MGVRRISFLGGAMLAIGCAGAVGGTAAPPTAPTELVAAAVSPTRIDLTWTDNSDNESVFVVERQMSGSTRWSVAWEQNNAGFPSLSDMGLPPNGRVAYRVKARAKDGSESPPSNVAEATTPSGPALFNNLLRDRRASASSFQWRKVPPYQAVDGTQWTRWWSKLSPENAPLVDWLCVDMGSRQSVDKVRLIWQRDWWAAKYEIQISDDATSWTPVLAVHNSALQPIEDRKFPPAAGRYLRFYGIESANRQKTWGGYGSYSLYEFQAYAPGVDPDPIEWESSAMLKPVVATRRPELAHGAVDGHLGTFWSCGPPGREYTLTVDLGREQDIYAVIPCWHVPTDAYQIRLSSDGAAWRIVADRSNVTVAPVENEELREIHTKEFESAEIARHVRVAVTGKPIHQDAKFTSVILQELLVRSAPRGAPRAPSDLRVTAVSSARVSLHWTDASANEAGFEIHRRELGTSRWNLVGAASADAMSFDDPSPAAEKSFAYRVRAVNEHGASLFSNDVRLR